MTPQEFKKVWSDDLSPLSKSRLEHFNLLKETTDFLHIVGLPIYCEPYLYFANDTDDVVYGINRLTEQNDIPVSTPESLTDTLLLVLVVTETLLQLIMATMTKLCNWTLKIYFSSMYFNSSIETFNFLVFYRDFEAAVLQGKDPDDNFQCYNFTDEQIEKLKGR